MPPTRRLTSTAYVLLGLLGLQAWTTYELSRQMERSLRQLWPRAESNLYGAARALVERGLATRSAEHHGRRPRALHAITRQPRPEDLANRMPTGYLLRHGQAQRIYPGEPPSYNVAPAVALTTTASDVAQFMIAQLEDGQTPQGRLLGEPAVAEMLR